MACMSTKALSHLTMIDPNLGTQTTTPAVRGLSVHRLHILSARAAAFERRRSDLATDVSHYGVFTSSAL